MGRIVNVCISEKKGTQKHPIDEGEFIVEFGLKGDAHAGKWHRQVSLLSFEKVEEFNSRRICHENCEDASPGEIEKHINSIKDDKENSHTPVSVADNRLPYCSRYRFQHQACRSGLQGYGIDYQGQYRPWLHQPERSTPLTER